MMIRWMLIAILSFVVVSSTSAFMAEPLLKTTVGSKSRSADSPQQTRAATMTTKKTQTTRLSMALEQQPPAVRKSVMSATVTVFAMPALTQLVATIGTAAGATYGTSQALAGIHLAAMLGNVPSWAVTASIFVVHFLVTDFFLQQFKDVSEIPGHLLNPQTYQSSEKAGP